MPHTIASAVATRRHADHGRSDLRVKRRCHQALESSLARSPHDHNLAIPIRPAREIVHSPVTPQEHTQEITRLPAAVSQEAVILQRRLREFLVIRLGLIERQIMRHDIQNQPAVLRRIYDIPLLQPIHTRPL